MRYQMKQKMWALGNDFTIKDEAGNDCFLVDGRVFSLGQKLSFQDMAGTELAFISQRLLSLHKCYEVYRDGALFAEISKEFTFFTDEYTVDVPGPNDYQVNGDFWQYEYQFLRDGCAVATVSKKFFSFVDTYGVEIAEGEDDITILATAVVIDLVNQERRR